MLIDLLWLFLESFYIVFDFMQLFSFQVQFIQLFLIGTAQPSQLSILRLLLLKKFEK